MPCVLSFSLVRLADWARVESAPSTALSLLESLVPVQSSVIQVRKAGLRADWALIRLSKSEIEGESFWGLIGYRKLLWKRCGQVWWLVQMSIDRCLLP